MFWKMYIFPIYIYYKYIAIYICIYSRRTPFSQRANVCHNCCYIFENICINVSMHFNSKTFWKLFSISIAIWWSSCLEIGHCGEVPLYTWNARWLNGMLRVCVSVYQQWWHTCHLQQSLRPVELCSSNACAAARSSARRLLVGEPRWGSAPHNATLPGLSPSLLPSASASWYVCAALMVASVDGNTTCVRATSACVMQLLLHTLISDLIILRLAIITTKKATK